MSIRNPDLVVSRVDLPPIGDRDARRIAHRRAEQLANESLEPAIFGSAVAAGKRPRPAWLVTCPAQFTSFAFERWRKQGLPVSHVASMHLALGALTKSIAPPKAGQLRAVLDIGSDHAVCVLTDAEGWLFSREVSIRLTRIDAGADEESSPIERLASELRRTFRYIDVELRLGSVSELLLSGSRKNLDELALNISELLDVPVGLVGDEISEGPIAHIDPAFAALVGMAIMPRLDGVNLIPSSARRELSRDRLRRRLSVATAASVILLGLAATWSGWRHSELTTRFESLHEEWVEGAEERVKAESHWEAQEFAEEVTHAIDTLGPSPSAWSWALRTLAPMLPDDAYIAQLSGARVDGEWAAELEIEFRGEDLATAAHAGSTFAEHLDASPLWNVERVARGTPSRTGAPIPLDGATVRVQFRIESRLSPLRFGVRKDAQNASNKRTREVADNG